MKIAFIVNDVKTEKPGYTTIYLALTAHKRGHKVYIAGVGDLGYSADGHMLVKSRTVGEQTFKSKETFLKAVLNSEPQTVSSVDLDVLFLRNDPSEDINHRNWAQNAPYIFGQIALRDGVIVLNHPQSLANAINKMYFQHFPEILRPRTIITRDPQEIEQFYVEQKQKMILKPLQGSGGKNIFVVDKNSKSNMNQIIEAISLDGFVIAQEYLPDAVNGDTRFFLMNGLPLQVKGKYAALRRINKEGDIRSNLHVGGRGDIAEVNQEMLDLVKVLKPKLIEDGMFLVGVDIVGNKLMEINVFSPGALNMISEITESDFGAAVITSIENKVFYKSQYGDYIDNISLAVL
ncbi:glutathione synthetase [Algoriphagus sp. A40]|uniref:glutathione synthetase n=1 Tax=Algoriphagus sp. A40 TaxID=1945863 RepID=UPI00098478F6|nr:glutathione synthetase [Algoriphagus sp. A40]OOG71904.1 glutathione synthetase [Algoriphagus sp. A40]